MLCIYAAAQRHEHFTGCGHDHLHSSKMDSDASYRAKHEAFEKLIQGHLEDMPEGNAKAAPPIYTLPVVFHVIHNNGPENISNAQAQQALQDLNNAFENIGYYDPTTGVDVQIAFCLARQAPNGGPTTGINRIVSPLTNFNMDINDLTVKNLSRWDPLRYINIWIVNEITSFQGSGVVGYAYLPSAHGQIYDGIVMEAGYTGNSPANSSVLVHEMGHYLGLYHTFQGGCTNNNCLVDGDRVCDTPPDANTAYITCGSSMNTCNTDDDDLRPVNPFRPLAQGGLGDQPDMHINYMDYSLLNCYSAFTQGQKDRMQLVVAGIRNSLLASSGCTSPCPAPINPAFTIAPNPASVGQSVNFTNTGGTSASYRWNINNVPFATTRNAANTFASVGTYRVSLIVDAGGVCQDSFVRNVTVSCSTSASFSASNLTPAAGTETVQFTNGSTGATSQQWLVNNVQVSTAQNLSRVFVSAGSYQVCLVASSATCSDTFCLGINALSPSSAENCSDGIDNDSDGRIDRLDADCVIAPSCNLNTGGLLSIATAWEGTTADLSPVLDPIVGDLDGDGIPEIIAGICGFSNAYGASSAANSSPGYRIYRGDGSNRTSTAVDVRIRLYTFDRLPMSNCAIADIDGNGTVEIVAVDRDGFVFVFPSSGGDATIPSTYLRKSTQPSSFYFGSVKIADINQDGTPEIIVGTDVFVWGTNTLEKRVSGSLSLPYGKNVFFPSWVTDVAIVDILQPQDCTNGNCAGLEIVAGSKVYSPDLINGTLNIVRDFSTIDNTVASNEDGPTAVADMNLDGNMDIVFAGENHLFIWSPRNSSVLLKNQNWVVRGYNRQQRGRPTIANYYNDTQNGYSINLPEVLVCTTSKLTSFNLNYPNGVQWNRNIPTLIGQISATAYDLNADGASELIYRDEFNMRIVNGNTTTPTDYATIQSYSLPVLESPTLADVDGDGQTNIVCAASDLLCNTNDPRSYPSRLRVYKSGTSGFWAPSRKIWNQRGCHPTAISDDLRVPRVEQSRTIQVPAGQTPPSYGLNTYNVQTTDNFLPPSYVSAPDLTGVITSFNCSTRSINFNISNLNGSTLAPTGISVTFYDGNPTTTNAPILGRFVTTQTIAAGATLNNLTATSSITPTSGSIYMVVNDGGSLARPFNLATQFPVTSVLECSYVNNIHSLLMNCLENCTDGIDNDGDGIIDLADPDCRPLCSGSSGNTLANPSFEIPVCTNLGNNFQSWPLMGWRGSGTTPNIVLTNGVTRASGGPIASQDGTQFLDIAGGTASFYQEFVFQCNVQVFFSGYFSIAVSRPSDGRIDLLRVNPNGSTTLVASSNQLNMPGTMDIWHLASGTAVITPGTYRFHVQMGDYSNFDNACFSYDDLGVSTGTYGPLCANDPPITLIGTPTNSSGTWSGTGVTNNGNGTATFNSSGLSGQTVSVTYTYLDISGVGCSRSTNITVTSCIEDCTDGIDNDVDGLIDEFDPDCNTPTSTTCTVANTGAFDMRLEWESAASDFVTNASSSVADLNGDGFPEVISPVTSGYRILQGNGNNNTSTTTDITISTANLFGFQDYAHQAAVGDLEGNGSVEIVAVDYSTSRVYVFGPNGGSTSNFLYRSNATTLFRTSPPRLVDINEDGIAEIVVGNEVFRLRAGILEKVITGNTSLPYGRDYFNTYGDPVIIDILSPADCPSGYCAGKEYVAGSKVFAADFVAGTWVLVKDLNSISPSQCPLNSDGPTCVGDLNLDGNLDVAYADDNHLYIWTPKLNQLLHRATNFTQGRQSFPNEKTRGLGTIANVYNDLNDGKTMDFPELLITTNGGLSAYNLNYPSAVTPNRLWRQTLTDDSGQTSPVTFDFDNNGYSEIVISDNTGLKVLDGNSTSPVVLKNISINNATQMENPIIADVDNDGEAEIITTIGGLFTGKLTIYRSNGYTWANCRKLWNQRGYRIVNVMNNLRIPPREQSMFTRVSPTSNKLVFNTANAQLASLNQSNQVPAINLSVNILAQTCVSNSSASVTYVVTNTGIPTGGGMSVSFYNGNPNTAGSTRILTINNLPALASGASVTLTQALTGLAAGNVVYILVNDNGSDPVPVTFPITGIPECDYTNNTALVTLTPCNNCTFDAVLSAVTVTCDRDSLMLTTQICNTGTGPIPANFGMSCWLDNPVTLASATRLGFLQTNTALAPNTCMPITFRIPRQLGNFTIVANDVIGSTPLLNLSNPPIPECNTTDNVVTGTFAGYPPPTLDLGPNINVCENGIANITAQDGFATYRWQDGFDGRQYTATRGGIYALTVTDICGFTQADTVTVFFSNPIVLNLPDTIRVCQGTSRIISAPVGVPSYTYSWFPNIELAGVTAANATITPTTNRTYQLIVTDVNGCLAVDSTHIEVQNCVEICNDGIDNNANGLIDCLDPFCAVALSLNDRDSACIGSSIQLNPITTASTIAWTGANGFTSTLRAPILSNIQLIDGGIYRITVTDSNGCTASDSIDIEVLGTPIITATGGVFCEQSLASISATGAVSYSWTSSNNWFGSGQTVLLGPANNALAGVYSVTGTDTNGCTASTSTTLQVIPAPSVSVSVTTNISCFGVCDGLIALTPNPNNVGYVWSNGGRGVVQSGLCAGTYSVTVSNSIGCTASLSNIVLNQPLQITAAITVVRPISCHGRCDAELMVSPSGGSGSYRILWDDGQFANTSSGRCFGPYSVTITDTNNCSTVVTGNLPTPLPMNAVIQSDDARCHGEPSGVAEAQVIGGTLPYSFLWNNAQIRAVATGLAAGNYSVTISDANGCSLSMATTIQEPTSLSASITGSFLDCFDGTDGNIQLSNISGGIPPYYAQWDDGTVGFIVTNRPIGSLGVVLSDANGCSLRLVGSVSAPTPLRIFADSLRMPTCHGYADGFASVNPQGGVWPYRYRWGNGSTFAQIQLVPAGVYEVTVTDANGCTAQNTSILIDQPSPLSLVLTPVPATLLCHGAENGSITPRITGGTMPYSYYWDDGARQSNRSGLPADRYVLLVKDANECAITDSVNITEPMPLNADVIVENPLCFGELGSFEIAVNSTTGRAPFVYAVNDTIFSNNSLYLGMGTGTYNIRVKDLNNCKFMDTISILEPLEIQLQLPDTFYVSPPNRAQLSSTVINAVGQVSYWWSPSTALDCATCAEPFSSVSQTTIYTLRITDANGCVAEANTIVLSENIPCLFVPNSFTPNDDGANDYFCPKSGECVSQIISLKIFDRWGELVFEQKNFEPNVPNLGWNGMFNGESMDNGVYVWSMDVLFQNGKREIVNGDVTLLK